MQNIGLELHCCGACAGSVAAGSWGKPQPKSHHILKMQLEAASFCNEIKALIWLTNFRAQSHRTSWKFSSSQVHIVFNKQVTVQKLKVRCLQESGVGVGWGWDNISAVERTGREPGFNPKPLHSGSPQFRTLVPGVVPPSSALYLLCMHRVHRLVCRQDSHTHIKTSL